MRHCNKRATVSTRCAVPFLDDIYATGHPDRTADQFRILQDSLRQHANIIQVHLGKTRAWNSEPPGLLDMLPPEDPANPCWTGSWTLPAENSHPARFMPSLRTHFGGTRGSAPTRPKRRSGMLSATSPLTSVACRRTAATLFRDWVLPHDKQGLNVLGTPFGSDAYIECQLALKQEARNRWS